MSDLSASHCGCGNSSRDNNFGCSGIIIILILFCLCGNKGDRCDCDDRCGNGILGGMMNGGCGCETIIIIILLLSCCGNGCSIF